MPRGTVSDYRQTATTTSNTAATCTVSAVTAAKSNDLDSCATSYTSVGDIKANRKSTDTTSGSERGNRDGGGEDVGCYWVVSPGWKRRRRAGGTTDNDSSATNTNLPVTDGKSSTSGDDLASSGTSSMHPDDTPRSQSAQGNSIIHN